MYNFIKLSDAPVVEDGATHVLGTKEGQVVRVPASGLSAVALDLDIGEAGMTPPKRAGCLRTGREFPGRRNAEITHRGGLCSR